MIVLGFKPSYKVVKGQDSLLPFFFWEHEYILHVKGIQFTVIRNSA